MEISIRMTVLKQFIISGQLWNRVHAVYCVLPLMH